MGVRIKSFAKVKVRTSATIPSLKGGNRIVRHGLHLVTVPNHHNFLCAAVLLEEKHKQLTSPLPRPSSSGSLLCS